MNPNLIIRTAQRSDLPEIVRLLAEDEISGGRECYETPLPSQYYSAFDAIASSDWNDIIVAEIDGAVVGTLQLMILPHLTSQGGKRAQVEAVFVDKRQQGKGIGKQLFEWVFATTRAAGCVTVQLTTNTKRPEARRFYEKLGFSGTHVGMKRDL